MRNFDEFVKSNIFKVNFAGFSAYGHHLAERGWDFSAYQGHSMRSFTYDLQLIMRHAASNLTMISQLQAYDLNDVLYNQRNITLRDRADNAPFEVVGVQIDNRSSFIMPMVKQRDVDFSRREFFPADMSPNYERIDLSQLDFNKFGVFRRTNEAANIFLPEKTVNELMEEILKKQAPVQAEIRANRKREEFMRDFNRNANEDIKLQLVAV